MNNIPPGWKYDFEYYGNEEGCGDLVLALYIFFKLVEPGKVAYISAFDIGAETDIPAWCRMTNKELLEKSPPHYLIRKNK